MNCFLFSLFFPSLVGSVCTLLIFIFSVLPRSLFGGVLCWRFLPLFYRVSLVFLCLFNLRLFGPFYVVFVKAVTFVFCLYLFIVFPVTKTERACVEVT